MGCVTHSSVSQSNTSTELASWERGRERGRKGGERERGERGRERREGDGREGRREGERD